MMNFKKISYCLTAVILLCALFSFTNIRKIAEHKWQGIASYYHPKFNGRKTATGEIFSNNNLTAANNFLKLGTLVKVTNLTNGKVVVVKINDRMNKRNMRLIDLSQAAAKKLGMFQQGVGEVSIEIIGTQTDYLAVR